MKNHDPKIYLVFKKKKMFDAKRRRIEASRDGITDLTNNHTKHMISAVKFGMYSAKEIHKISVIPGKGLHEINIHDANLPKFNGVNDMRLGVVDLRTHCPTCGNGVDECTGHFGHIDLVVPVYHIGFTSTILMTLRSVCFWCSALLVDKTDPKLVQFVQSESRIPKKVRFTFITSIAKSKTCCLECGGRQPQYTKGNAETALIDAVWDAKIIAKLEPEEQAIAKSKFLASDAHQILKDMSPEDAEFLGLHHPENMIITTLIVPPPSIRPSITVSLGSRAKGQDDITRNIKDIIKCNEEMKTKLQANPSLFPEAGRPTESFIKDIRRLQACVSSHIGAGGDESGTAAVAAGGGKSRKRNGASLRKRLKGKNGRMRGQIMGKRVDFSARTVIKPDPCIDADEVSVPPYFATILTVPVKVTARNIFILQKRVRVGPGKLDGAATVVDDKGRVIDLKYAADRDTIRLQIGWVVRRYLANGDRVILNRQPSLHKESMMVHKVRIAKSGSTMGLNLTCVTPYNADFDGDEMNMYVVQSVEEMAELEGIMSVAANIVSPQSNKPVQGLVQDALVGAFLLTKESVRLTKSDIMDLCMVIQYYKSGTRSDVSMADRIPPPRHGHLWAGSQVMSMLFPEDLTLKRHVRGLQAKDATTDTKERVVEIVNGHLVRGRLCKDTLGTGSNGIVHILYRNYCPDTAVRFMSDMMRVTNRYLTKRGFSMGLADMVTPRHVRLKVDQVIDEGLAGIDAFTRQALDAGAYPEQIEDAIMNRLQGIADIAGRVVTSALDVDHNGLLTGIESGAKGKMANMGQIMACGGQATVEGVRLKGSKWHRALPCMKRADISPLACGYIVNPYNVGLTPPEFYFHAQNGREGIVDTACKTAKTGYIHRKVEKALESACVAYDMTVRDADGSIIEYCYGGDGNDATHLIKQPVHNDPENTCPQFAQLWQQFCDTRRNMFFRDLEAVVHVPCDVPSLIETVVAKRLVSLLPKDNQTITEQEVETQVNELCYELAMEAHTGAPPRMPNWDAVLETSLVIRHALQPRLIVHKHALTRGEFASIMTRIRKDHQKARVAPGEMVGSVAAEAAAEPMMQMTLNTFKFTGQSAQNVTQGVPRIEEIIHCTKIIKTPSMKIPMAGGFAECERAVRDYASVLPKAFLHNVVESSMVIYDPDPSATVVDQDRELCDLHFMLFGQYADIDVTGLSTHVIRFALDRQRVMERSLTPALVGEIIQRFCSVSFSEVIASDVNMDPWVVRVRLGGVRTMIDKDGLSDAARQDLEKSIMQSIQNTMLQSVCLGGIEGVHSVVVTTVSDHRLESKKRFCIETDGTCLPQIFTLDDVVWDEVISNDICEVEELMGIEAAAAVTHNELHKVIAFDNNYVNQRHIHMIINWMTCKGKLTPISRHGINHLDTGPLVRASFEETDTVLFEAALFMERDDVKSITASMCVHRLARMGTGVVDILTEYPYKLLCEEYNALKKKAEMPLSKVIQSMATTAPRLDEKEDDNAWMELSDSESSDSDEISRRKSRAQMILTEAQRLEQIKEWLWNDYGNTFDEAARFRTLREKEPCGIPIAPTSFVPATVFSDTKPRNILASAMQENLVSSFVPLSPVLPTQDGEQEHENPIMRQVVIDQKDPLALLAKRKMGDIKRPFIPMSPMLIDNILMACKRRDDSPKQNQQKQPFIHPLQKGIHLRNVCSLISITVPSKIFDTKGKISFSLFDDLLKTLSVPAPPPRQAAVKRDRSPPPPSKPDPRQIPLTMFKRIRKNKE